MSQNLTTCETMLTYSTSIELRLSLLLNWFILLPAFPIIGYSLYFSFTQRVFHKNTQIQISIHLAALFSLHTADLFNYFYPYQSGCEILPNFYRFNFFPKSQNFQSFRCLIFRFLYNAGQATVSMTPISITLERLIAVKYNRAYENCSINYGIFLGVFQIFLAICYLFTRYVHAAFTPSSFTFFYCQTLVSSTISTAETIIPLSMVICSQIISIVVFRILEIKNKKLRAVADINLSTRYTLDQGRRSFVALKSFIHFNCITISTILLGIVVLHLASPFFTKPNYMAIIELTHAIPLYGIIVCIGVWWKLRILDGEQRRNITMALRRKPMHTDLYFQMRKIQFSAKEQQETAAFMTRPKIEKLIITGVLSNWSEEKATFAPPEAFIPNCENLKLADFQQECLLEWITSSLQIRREFKNFEIDCWSVEVPIRPFIQGLKVSKHLKIRCETGMTDEELEGIEAMDLTVSSDQITPAAAKIRLLKFLKFGKRHEKLEIRTVHPQFFDAQRDLFSDSWIVKKIPQDYEEGGEFIGKIFSGFENIHGIQDTREFSCDYYGDSMRIFCAVVEKSKTSLTLYPF
ncbi:Protein CBR-SRAB-13 [Caenorhabditis briggsae]|uniref:Protein CBR-SRAB-13 n=1 Tax=Caenorhabditis briggsae TaxID=6238 RepID=A8X1W5_CAEBR|nr:Protein CBR-SRAB-13 [Caenorhabditis briggsae]CAP26625.2 Protein CBR-SRAB-13 [Caenorhabditis briggsae]